MDNYDYNIVTKGDWFITAILMLIPVVNVIMLFVWSFGTNTKPSLKNWAQLQLILSLIGVIVVVLLATVFNINLAAIIKQAGIG